MKAIVHFDGGCRPRNPGHAGAGVIIYMNYGDGKGQSGTSFSRYLGIKTNNQAEYIACILGIKYAKELGANSIKLCTDSQLVANQVNGEWKTQADLKPYLLDTHKLLKRLFPDAWEIVWWRRSNNGVADQLATEALNWGRNHNPFTPQKIKDKRPGNIVDPFNEVTKPPYPLYVVMHR